MLKGAIFDADGTLLDSMQVWCELGARYLARHDIKAKKNLSDILYPLSLEESSYYLKETYHLLDDVEMIITEILDMIQFFYLNEVILKPGAADYLRYLRNQNIPMIVATSNEESLLRSVFTRLQINDYFQAILTCSGLNTNKREPMIYLKAIQEIGTLPQETAVFEDSLYGILSAAKAGFITVAVDDASNCSKTGKLRNSADHFICDFIDPILRTI